MNKIVLFRGKRIDNGEWVYGDLVEQCNPEYHAYIFADFKAEIDETYIDILSYDIYEIEPKTIGQFIGKQDKNNQRIFDDDILMFDTWGEKTFVRVCYYGYYATPEKGEVIGNIWDNPELISKEEK